MMPTLAIMAMAVASAATTTEVRESEAVSLRAGQQSFGSEEPKREARA